MVSELQAATLNSQEATAEDSREDNQNQEEEKQQDTLDESEDSGEDTAKVLEKVAEVVQKYRDPSIKLETAREDLEYERQQVQKGNDENLTKGLLPIEQGVLIGGRPVNFYSYDQEEFRDLKRRLYEASKSSESGVTFDLIESLNDAYHEYQKRMEKRHTEIMTKESQIEAAEWDEIESEVLAEAPEVKPYLTKIATWINEEVNKRPAVRARLATKAGKVDMVVRAIKALKIDQKLDTTVEDEPSIHRGAVARSSGAPKKTGKKIYTREEISKMSTKQYEELEADIEAAQREGRIK